MPPLRETAEAKLNLTLRVLGRRSDGYHEICSLVAFARLGDALELAPGPELSLTIEGPFADALKHDDGDNLVLRAAQCLANAHCDLRNGAFRLVKRLPVAAGLGGGSADAAAVLRLLLRANPKLDSHDVSAQCSHLGADVAVCLSSRAAYMWGIGEKVQPLDAFPPIPVTLVNPGQALSTAEVFAALAARPLAADAPPPLPALPRPFADAEALVSYLRDESNDLQRPAMHLAPAIAEVLSTLEAAPGCRLARMSGSGATCFGIFSNATEAAGAAKTISVGHPDWWVAASKLH